MYIHIAHQNAGFKFTKTLLFIVYLETQNSHFELPCVYMLAQLVSNPSTQIGSRNVTLASGQITKHTYTLREHPDRQTYKKIIEVCTLLIGAMLGMVCGHHIHNKRQTQDNTGSSTNNSFAVQCLEVTPRSTLNSIDESSA